MDRQPPFVRLIAQALRQRCHVRQGQPLLVAVSGGSDSIALLHILTQLMTRRNWNLTLHVGHVNHQLRHDADDDATFVASIAKQWQLPFHSATLDPATRRHDNLEQCARHQRYAALARMAHDASATCIVTAHHADDQLETLLMRLLRGCAVQSLAGMKWTRRLTPGSPVRLLRPMLGVTHAQLIDYLQTRHIPWREDHTNTDLSRTRAALRSRVLPTLAKIAPHYPKRITQTCDHLRDVASLYHHAVATLHQHAVTSDTSRDVSLPRHLARSATPAILQGTLRAMLLHAGVPADTLSHHTLATLASKTQDHQGGRRRFTFARGVTATLTRNNLTIHPVTTTPPLPASPPPSSSSSSETSPQP